MENYFLTKIGTKEKSALEKHGVNFCDMGIDDEKGIVMTENDIEEALKVLNFEIKSVTKTAYEGILKITPIISKNKGERKHVNFIKKITEAIKRKVVIDDWNGEQQEEFRKITEEILLPVVKKDIYLSVPHAHTVEPRKDGKFHIFIWSSPLNNRADTKPPKNMWGYHVSRRDQGYVPSGRGVPILDYTGYAVAELIGDNLYIHHDICHLGTTDELNIYRRLLEEVAVEMTFSPKEKEERRKEISKKGLKISRKTYIEKCARRNEIELKNLQESIDDIKAEIEKNQKTLVKEIRELQENEARIKYLKSDDSNKSKKYGLEFDKLISLPKVVDVWVQDDVIRVFTNTLFCDDPRTGKTHEIGKFRIEIYIDGSNGGIKWFNLTRQVEGYKPGMQAPHIFPDGDACLGNMEEVIPELIANYEFSVAAMLAIQFVESVDVEDSAGKYINEWPVAKDSKKEE